MLRPNAKTSPSIRRVPMRIMPTRLWYPTGGTGAGELRPGIGAGDELKAASADRTGEPP